MDQLGAAAFAEQKREMPQSTDENLTRYVRCVANAIAREVAPDVEWEVRLFDSPQANAFALPGGKIGVFTGMLDVAETQDQLAAVLAHEIAHVTAQHANSRISAATATEAGLTLGGLIAGVNTPAKRQVFALLGMGAKYGVILPYGRGQETEADVIGLQSMAKAGFDPRGAVELWQNMSAATGGREPPEFLSTHPSHEGRIEELTERMPQALQLYASARNAGRNPTCAVGPRQAEMKAPTGSGPRAGSAP